jgi:hypothetical protein
MRRGQSREGRWTAPTLANLGEGYKIMPSCLVLAFYHYQLQYFFHKSTNLVLPNMRLLFHILVCTTSAASTIYKRSNGSALVLGDLPVEVDLSDVVLPQSSTDFETTVYVASGNVRICLMQLELSTTTPTRQRMSGMTTRSLNAPSPPRLF